MAARMSQSSAALFMILCLTSLRFSEVSGARTKDKIYIDLVSQNSCFRLLNATHQVGCSSGQEGNTGVVHYMQTEADWSFVLQTGPSPPYVPVLPSANFTLENVLNLTFSGRVNGIIVISVNLTSDLEEEGGFSVDSSCPNDAYGYYKNTQDAGCQRVKWNPAGTGLMFENLDLPIFSLTEQSDVDTVLNKCWEPFNKPVDGRPRTFPLCAVQLVSAMTAARDTQTCVRRSRLITNLNPFVFCDPLGDKNVVATLKAVPSNQTRRAKSVILVATRMDSMSLFHNEYPSSDSTVTGIVALLAAAKALWSVRDAINNDSSSRDVMFVFFQGEAYDYIGSSRMLYDMQGGRFPEDFSSDDDQLHLQKVNLSHIAQFVELSQVGMRRDEDSLWLHVDPSVRNRSAEVQTFLNKLKEYGADTNVTFQESQDSLPLPPASLQRFLMAMGNESLPSFVVTDHRASFTNKYYNSRLDLPGQIRADYPPGLNDTERYSSPTVQSRRIAALATALTRYLYWASTGREPHDSLAADADEVNHMLYCFLYSPHCELFNFTVSPDNADALKKNKKPFPFYVSVNQHTNEVTSLVRQVLTLYTGQQVSNATKDTCKVTDNDQRYSYLWMQGSAPAPEEEREHVCYQSTVFLSTAQSPAFDIQGYDWESGVYSTWTESRWDTFKLRVFLLPSKQFQVLTLLVGVGFLFVSLVLVYFINSSADVLFHNSISELT